MPATASSSSAAAAAAAKLSAVVANPRVSKFPADEDQFDDDNDRTLETGTGIGSSVPPYAAQSPVGYFLASKLQGYHASLFGDSPTHSSSSPFDDFDTLDFQDGLVAPYPSRVPSPIPFEPFDGSKVFEDIFGLAGFPEDDPSQGKQPEQPAASSLPVLPSKNSPEAVTRLIDEDYLEKLKGLADSKGPLSSSETAEAPPTQSGLKECAQEEDAPTSTPTAAAGRVKRVPKRKFADDSPYAVQTQVTKRAQLNVKKGQPLSPPSPTLVMMVSSSPPPPPSSELPAPSVVAPALLTPIQSPKMVPFQSPVSLPPQMHLPSAFAISSDAVKSSLFSLAPSPNSNLMMSFEAASRHLTSHAVSIDPSSLLPPVSSAEKMLPVLEKTKKLPKVLKEPKEPKLPKTPKMPKEPKELKEKAKKALVKVEEDVELDREAPEVSQDELESSPSSPSSPSTSKPAPSSSKRARLVALLLCTFSVVVWPSMNLADLVIFIYYRLLDPVKKASHNEMEKKRRDEMRDDFEFLKNCVPGLPADLVPKITILSEAEAYITALMAREKEHAARLIAMKKQNEVFKSRLQTLEKKGSH